MSKKAMSSLYYLLSLVANKHRFVWSVHARSDCRKTDWPIYSLRKLGSIMFA